MLQEGASVARSWWPKSRCSHSGQRTLKTPSSHPLKSVKLQALVRIWICRCWIHPYRRNTSSRKWGKSTRICPPRVNSAIDRSKKHRTSHRPLTLQPRTSPSLKSWTRLPKRLGLTGKARRICRPWSQWRWRLKKNLARRHSPMRYQARSQKQSSSSWTAHDAVGWMTRQSKLKFSWKVSGAI